MTSKGMLQKFKEKQEEIKERDDRIAQTNLLTLINKILKGSRKKKKKWSIKIEENELYFSLVSTSDLQDSS